MAPNTLQASELACKFAVPTRHGPVMVEISDKGIRSIQLPMDEDVAPCGGYQRVSPEIQEISYKAIKQLSEYFEGRRRIFRLPIDPSGTDFQLRVWDALSQIPYGQTRTYGQIAEQLDEPGAARAVGQACGANPIPVVIPCHRILGSQMALGGFSAGNAWKRRLLDIEGVRVG
ncbi:MAG: methylated-DNA--[protein]-cysteine S-methyltransferase [Phycisphaeraceae bacterium]|nr:methylated-DNA--[protein]-cysteine S-methyltransferase [Phycisphaeraceae bacterium]